MSKKFDERERKLSNEAMAITTICIFLYKIGLILYKLNSSEHKLNSISMGMDMVWLIVFGLMLFLYISITYSVNKSKKNNIFSDEREKKKFLEFLGVQTYVIYIYEIIAILIKISMKSYNSINENIITLAIPGLVISLYRNIKKDYNLPKSFFGGTLPIRTSKEDKKERMKYYLKDAVIPTMIFTGISLMTGNILDIFGNKALNIIMEIVLRMIIFFSMDYFWGEWNVKKYNRYYDSLENDI